MQTKARFLTDLWAARAVSKKDPSVTAWRLAAPLIYQSALIGRVAIPAGFQTDFASVPRLPFAYLFFGDRCYSAAVIHDYLCRIEYPTCRITWKLAAAVFMEAMLAENVPAWQRWPMYTAVLAAGALKKSPCTNRSEYPMEGS